MKHAHDIPNLNMTNLQISLNDVRDGSILKQCPNIVQEMLDSKYGILNVIVALRECLTHPESVYRSGGIKLIAGILKLLPKSFLKLQELRELSMYMCERLKDQHNVVPAALESVLILIVMDNLPEDCVVNLLKCMFSNIPCQQQLIKDRLTYISIIRMLILKRPAEMTAMGDILMTGFVNSIDGERDPKCLVLNYRTFVELSKLLPNFDTSEDMFEVFAVYFPIDFSAPVDSDRPYTRDNLASLLKSCLLAYSSFSKYLLPLIIEKLDSQFEVAKMDSLELLLESCDTYSDADYKLFLIEICKLLRLEILTGTDSKTCYLSLKVLNRLIETLKESRDDCIEIVLNFSLTFLRDTSSPLYTTIINVLYTAAMSSKSACEKILERVLPIILEPSVTMNTVTGLNVLLTSYKTMEAEISEKLIKDVIEYLTQDMPDLKITSLALTTVSLINTKADYDTRCMVYTNSLKIISNDSTLAEHFIPHLLDMARFSTEDFKIIVIPTLVQNLANDATSLKRVEILLRLAFIEELTDLCFEEVIKLIKNQDLYPIVLQTILDVIKINKENNFIYIINRLICKYNILEEIESVFMQDNTEIDDSTFNVVSQIFANLFPYLPPDRLSKQINTNRKLWNNKTLAIVSGLVCNLPRSYDIPNLNELCTCLIESALSISKLERLNANITIYKIVNRTSDNDNLSQILNDIWKHLKLLFNQENLWIFAVESWSWITKALLMRGHIAFGTWLQEIYNLETLFGDLLPLAYRILCIDCSIYDGNTQLLHKQRLFAVTISFLDKNQKSASSLFVYNLLIDHVPKSVLNIYSDKISSILAESIRSDNSELLWISLLNIKKILEIDAGSVSLALYENIDRFLPKLLDIAVQGERQDQRRLALIIIDIYGNSRNFLTKFIQYKPNAMICLKKSLNDPKRDIRFIVHESLEKWTNIDNEL